MTSEFQALELTSEERFQLAELTSLQFGHLDEDSLIKKKPLMEKAISYYENLLSIGQYLSNLDTKEKEKENEPNAGNISREREKKDERMEVDKDQKESENGKSAKDGRECKDTKDLKESLDKIKKRKPLDSWVYCRLGHLHLLLEHYARGE
ncbi:hypothetical protein C0Q70_21625 [Pomacea canaliculata]|uniref:Uncharacterized protein n=1 Tax=Pomacea canaliculata TaxID=400727 RepID=A0A2T7ND15_POMCA|nr:hypothetical protein C0Q70_21625 [Pomacea canaliculata]